MDLGVCSGLRDFWFTSRDQMKEEKEERIRRYHGIANVYTKEKSYWGTYFLLTSFDSMCLQNKLLLANHTSFFDKKTIALQPIYSVLIFDKICDFFLFEVFYLLSSF